MPDGDARPAFSGLSDFARGGSAGSRLPSLNDIAYVAAQGPRLAWYIAQYIAAARVTKPADTPPELIARMPHFREILAELRVLMQRDAQNIADGVYRLPPEPANAAFRSVSNAIAFFRDLPHVEARRHARINAEVNDAPNKGRYPRYYLQNFHYQTDGYLSADSAALYDHQVEILFAGGADAMRRMALPAIRHALASSAANGRPIPMIKHADVATGTGRFLATIKANFPRMRSVGVDLSPPYLQMAAEKTAAWKRTTRFVQAPAEHLPFADASLDLITCVYLFHELPPKVREAAAREFARVLRPGGTLVFVDTLQLGDTPKFDPLLEFFPRAFHEPYYDSFIRMDLKALFGAAGLRVSSAEPAYLNKIVTAVKAT